jgi:hypothetical protein
LFLRGFGVTPAMRRISCLLERTIPPDTDLRLFQQFRFPIFSCTKVEMQRVAREQGFADLMEMTWFCYSPTRRMEPCGRCNPCRYTAEEGLSRRIPRVTRLRVQCGRLLRRARKILRRGACRISSAAFHNAIAIFVLP